MAVLYPPPMVVTTPTPDGMAWREYFLTTPGMVTTGFYPVLTRRNFLDILEHLRRSC